MFNLDHRLLSSCIFLDEWPLSSVFLKNNSQYPWFILIPRQADVRSIDMLAQDLRYQLTDEIHRLSIFIKNHFQPEQLNVGALGNIVPQLHVHIIARFTHDKLWPHGVWQADLTESPYANNERAALIQAFHQGTR